MWGGSSSQLLFQWQQLTAWLRRVEERSPVSAQPRTVDVHWLPDFHSVVGQWPWNTSCSFKESQLFKKNLHAHWDRFPTWGIGNCSLDYVHEAAPPEVSRPCRTEPKHTRGKKEISTESTFSLSPSLLPTSLCPQSCLHPHTFPLFVLLSVCVSLWPFRSTLWPPYLIPLPINSH